MLDELRVENLGIIEEATIEPSAGLVAITGETGAGKTLLLGALRLLRGDPARSDNIGPHGDEAMVEGRFVISGDEHVASRRVGRTRSRAYLDGSMVPAGRLTTVFDGAIQIVAQHEHLALGRESSLRAVVDGRLDPMGQTALDTYRATFAHLKALESELASIGGDERQLARELDLLRHQAAEITSAAPTVGEDQALAAMLRRLRHAEEITEGLGTAVGAVDAEGGAIDQLRLALDTVRTAAKLDPDLEGQSVAIQSIIVSAEDTASQLKSILGSVDLDPAELTAAEGRQAQLADLKRKYGASLDEVLVFGTTAASRANDLEQMLERAGSITAEIALARSAAIDAGGQLASMRRIAAGNLVDGALMLLRSLGFSDPILRLEVEDARPTASGADRMSLLFASDSGLTPGPVSKVASGGELSRLVLSVRTAAGVAEAPIVAFDEVDAGVGGSTALAMGEQLAALAVGGQVFVVTHLPQVAAFADQHLVVRRTGATASVAAVEGAQRLAELARMLGGMEESVRGRLHAEELLSLAVERRS